jgi:general stress protein CsbA
MLGEFLREAAVLVLVFVPLEFYKSGFVHPFWIIGVVVFSLAVLTGGIALERQRPL